MSESLIFRFYELSYRKTSRRRFLFIGVVLFSESEDHPFAFFVADHQSDCLIVGGYVFDLTEGLKASKSAMN